MNFSAVVPLYNGARTLAATLDSILAQTCAPADVIVVDDGSTDGGAAIAAHYGSRVTVLTTGANSGVQAARNLGISRAHSEWIALCDQDDLWAPDYLARHAALIDAMPRLDFVFCNFQRLVDGVPEAASKFDQAPPGFWQEAGRRIVAKGWVFDRPIAGLTFVWHPIFPSATVLTRKLIDDAGGFNPAMRGLRPEDGEFTLRCLYRATTGAIPDPLVTIRRHEANFSRDALLSLVDEIAALQFVRANHAEARPFWRTIDAEIRSRRIRAAHSAFARGEHQLFRQLLADIDPADRDVKLRLKTIVASLPEPLGARINRILQGMRGAVGDVRRASG